MYILAGWNWTEECLDGMHTQVEERINWISKHQQEKENVA